MTNPVHCISILRRSQLEEHLQISRSTIYDKINPRSKRYDKSFPKPIRLGPRSVGWLLADVQKWLEQRIEQGRQPSA